MSKPSGRLVRWLCVPPEVPPRLRRFACRHCHGLTYKSRQAHDKFLDPYLRMHPLRRAAAAAAITDLHDKIRVLGTCIAAPEHTPAYYEQRWDRQAISGPLAMSPDLAAHLVGVLPDQVAHSFR